MCLLTQKQPPRTTAWPTGIKVPTGLYQKQYIKYVPKPNTSGMTFTLLQDMFLASHLLPPGSYKDRTQLEKAWLDSLEAAECYLQQGGDVNLASKNGQCKITLGLNIMTICALGGHEALFRKYMNHELDTLKLNPFVMDGVKSFAIHRFARNPLRTENGCVDIIWEILRLTASLIEPNASEQRIHEISNKLLEIPAGHSGNTVLIQACMYGNIALLEWLTKYFDCDFSILGIQDGYSALAAACTNVKSVDTKLRCLKHLVLDYGQNIAEIHRENPNDPMTPLARSGVLINTQTFRDFLINAHATSPELFNEVVKQIANSSNPQIKQKMASFGGLNKIFGILNRELDASMQAALQNARTPIHLKNT